MAGKRLACLLLCLALVGCGLTGCGKEEAATSKVPELLKPVGMDMDTVAAARDTIYNIEVVNAEVVPYSKELSFGSSGTIGEVHVREGEKVKKGDLLAELRESDFKDRLEEKKQQISDLRQSHSDSNTLSQYDVTILREELKQLQKELKDGKDKARKKQLQMSVKEKESDIRIAERKLSHDRQIQQLEVNRQEKELQELQDLGVYFEIRANMDGEVGCIVASSGAMITVGVTVMGIADPSRPMIGCGYIKDSDLNKCNRVYALHNGKEYEVELQDYDREEANRRVELGENVKIRFKFKGDVGDVKVGDFIAICLVTDYVEGALVVPANAVMEDGETKYVYKVEGQSKIKQEVSIGTVTPANIEIIDGLQEGDVVYVQN